MNLFNLFKNVPNAALATAFVAMAFPTVYGGESCCQEAPTREESVVVSMVAEVTAVSLESRTVTLKDELGKEVTMPVGEEVQRLNEVEVGDLVKADYYLSLAYELREPTADELANPLQVIDAEGRATTETAPAGAQISIITAVCTIEGLDRPTETVTLMGPLGGLNVVKVLDVNNMPALRIGQSVVVTFTQAAAISLEKVGK